MTTIFLGTPPSTIELPSTMIWQERTRSQGVAREVAWTIEGRMVEFAQAVDSGHEITLETREDVAWLDAATVEAVLALAAVAGGRYTLGWDDERHTVAFRGGLESPAVEMEPLFPGGTDWFTGVIRLIKVVE